MFETNVVLLICTFSVTAAEVFTLLIFLITITSLTHYRNVLIWQPKFRKKKQWNAVQKAQHICANHCTPAVWWCEGRQDQLMQTPFVYVLLRSHTLSYWWGVPVILPLSLCYKQVTANMHTHSHTAHSSTVIVPQTGNCQHAYSQPHGSFFHCHCATDR